MINFYANDFGILLRSCAQKNYENPSIFLNVTAKKPVAPFFLGHGVVLAYLIESSLLLLHQHSILHLGETTHITVFSAPKGETPFKFHSETSNDKTRSIGILVNTALF